MGSGKYLGSVSHARLATRNLTGASAFQHYESTRRAPRSTWKVHPDLDPFEVDVRESRDSDEHPNSLAIAILFDETGSMKRIPQQVIDTLPDLYGHLTQGGLVDDPQLLFGAFGDAYSDRVPLQIGQFESDNRFEDNLEKAFLEGNGGSQKTESYELALYFMARHTSIDCFEKRGLKGYLFMIGDEMAYPEVNGEQVAQLIGDGYQGGLTIDEVIAEVRQKYHFYFIIPSDTYNSRNPQMIDFWKSRLGDHVIQLDNIANLNETIGDVIAKDDALAGLKALVGDA